VVQAEPEKEEEGQTCHGTHYSEDKPNREGCLGEFKHDSSELGNITEGKKSKCQDVVPDKNSHDEELR
jgi:hypothetical protein